MSEKITSKEALKRLHFNKNSFEYCDIKTDKHIDDGAEIDYVIIEKALNDYEELKNNIKEYFESLPFIRYQQLFIISNFSRHPIDSLKGLFNTTVYVTKQAHEIAKKSLMQMQVLNEFYMYTKARNIEVIILNEELHNLLLYCNELYKKLSKVEI